VEKKIDNIKMHSMYVKIVKVNIF